jgi:flagellar basal body rod protein FlgC
MPIWPGPLTQSGDLLRYFQNKVAPRGTEYHIRPRGRGTIVRQRPPWCTGGSDSGVSGLLDIGKKSLFASQSAIEVVGNNISNANTEGYSRQAVVLEDGLYLKPYPRQLGTGVNATQVIRYFDEFIESQYNTKTSEQERWSTLYDSLQNVEGLLNESNFQWAQFGFDPVLGGLAGFGG